MAEFIPQLGAAKSQVPSLRQVNNGTPFREYPSSHMCIATVVVLSVLRVTSPWSGIDKVSQAAERD